MLFQLWSHTHLYRDVDNSNRTTSGKRAASPAYSMVPTCFPWYTGSRADLEKDAESVSCSRTSSSSSVSLAPPHRHPYLRTPESSSESLVLNSDMRIKPEVYFGSDSSISVPSQSVKLVPMEHGPWSQRENSAVTLPVSRVASTSSLLVDKKAHIGDRLRTEQGLNNVSSEVQDGIPVPLLSWPMIGLLLVSVTIVSASR